MKTKNVSVYSLPNILSDRFIQVQYQNLTFCHYREIHMQRNVKLLSMVLIHPNTFWPNEIVVLILK